MAIVLKDRVKETTTTTGTGTLTLTGAVAGYQSFDAIGSGSQTYYTIVDNENDTWEVGIGTYTSGGSRTLTRTTILSSSNAGSAVSFAAGTKDVFITYPGEKAIYEEPNGETLIDGGPITVLGSGVTVNPSLPAELGKFVGNVNSFGQVYNLNQNDGSSASADFVVYNDDTTDGYTHFTDMGINSSNYSSVDYPIFTPGSGYVFHDGDDFFIGNQTANKDLVLFAGGADTTNEAIRIKGADQAVELASDLSVAGATTITGAAVFQDTVLLDADPTLALQAATKQYVDNATSNGFHVHTPVLVATTGNLTATYSNGTSGVGATLTNSGAQAALSVDGVSLSVNDRVLVWQQTTGTQNGVYVVTTVGSGATNWVLTRSSDADTSSEGDPNSLGGGDYFFVQSGATLGYHSFVCTNTSTITFGTTAITFSEFSSVPAYTGTSPINVSGSVISLSGAVPATNGGTGTTTVTTGDLLYGSATNTWSKLAAGSAYRSLVMNAGGTNVEWNAVALDQSNAVSGTLGATNGGTGLNTYTLGDIVYSSASNTLSALAGNTTTTKKYLIQTGTGSASAAPSWGTIDGADVSGNISGQAGSVANALTAGTYLTAGGTYNGSAAITFAVDATSANTASKVVARDSSGNFSAGTITATLSGAATSATTATNVAGGAANQIVYNTGSGTTAFIDAPVSSSTYLYWNGSAFAYGTVASSITGTANQITASASSGAITLSTPQSIATTSSVQFGSFGVGTAASGTTGEIRATNNITAYYSDERLKTKISDIQDPLAKVREIKTMIYHANEVAVALGYDASVIEVGVSAQSVQAVQPEAVAPAPIDEQYLTVRYERLVPLLIEAIKALDAKVDALAKDLK